MPRPRRKATKKASAVLQVEVDNPFATERGHRKEGGKNTVVLQVARGDHILTMKARGIIDEVQFEMARKIEGWIEALERSGCGSADPSREFVDVSGTRDPIPDRVVRAGQSLAHCQQVLGTRWWGLVRAIVSGEETFGTAAYRVSASSLDAGRREVSKQFKDGLDQLAERMGYGR
jgi:hypothetical protein